MYPVKPRKGKRAPLITLIYRAAGHYIAGLHTGTDFGWTRPVEFVRASWRGTVVHIGRRDVSYGNYVVVRHPDGSESWYCHLAAIRPALRVGTKIHTGRLLGIMGQTGNASGRHLHYEERHAPYGYFDHRAPEHFDRPVPERLKGWFAA